MTYLFGRHITVVADDIAFEGRGASGFRVDFSVSRTATKEPNKGQISIYNPSRTQSIALSLSKRRPLVRIFAGYEGTTPMLLGAGNAVRDGVNLEYSGSDRVLKIQFADGLRKYQGARAALSIRGKVRLSEAITQLAAQIGLPVDLYLDEADDQLIQNGLHLSGAARDVLDGLAASVKAGWSIQNGRLQLVGQRRTTRVLGRLFSYENGTLIQAPNPRGGAKCVFHVLLAADVSPGVRFQVDAGPGRPGSGVWACTGVQHAGSNYGTMTSTIEARRS